MGIIKKYCSKNWNISGIFSSVWNNLGKIKSYRNIPSSPLHVVSLPVVSLPTYSSFFTVLLFLFVSACNSDGGDDPCFRPSFHCSGGFYSLFTPTTKSSFSFEKWEAKMEEIDSTEAAGNILVRFQVQKDRGNFTILSMGYKTPTRIPEFVHSPEYAQFLSFYSQTIAAGLVDYLNVGEETAWDVAEIITDLRERFPHQKFGSWPGRPADLVPDCDFYMAENYKARDMAEFDYLLATGKELILVVNATPGLEDIGNSWKQLDFARSLNLPIMFFAVSERNSATDYYHQGGEQFIPYYQMVEQISREQLKFEDR